MKPLKPVMAAILAASSFTSPLARVAYADEPTQITDAAAREKAVGQILPALLPVQDELH